MTGGKQDLPPLLTGLSGVLHEWPCTPAMAAAVDFVCRHEPAYLVQHSIRSYVYARHLGMVRGLHPGEDYDDETMFLGAVLHDIGLTDEANGSQRFEVDGADRAARFVRDQGLGPAPAETVWDAVALHTSPGIVNRRRPEIALPAAGIAADLFGYGADTLDPAVLAATHRHLPLGEVGDRIARQIASQILDNPAKLAAFTFSAAAVQWKAPSAAPPGLAQMVLRTSHHQDISPRTGQPLRQQLQHGATGQAPLQTERGTDD